MFEAIRSLLKGKRNEIAILVDGPNILRKSFSIDLTDVRSELSKYGRIRTATVYLDQYAPDKLIEAIRNQGFDTTTTTGDVDVTMAIEAMEHVLDPDVDTIALMTRDTDYLPVLMKARKKGKKTIILATDFAFSAALKNTADNVIIFKGKGEVEHIKNQ